MCAGTRASFWRNTSRRPRSLLAVRNAALAYVSWIYRFHNGAGSVSSQFGAQGIRALLPMRLLPGVQPTAYAQRAGPSAVIVFTSATDTCPDAGQQAAPPAHRFLVGLRNAAQPSVDLDQFLRQLLALAGEHRAHPSLAPLRPGFPADFHAHLADCPDTSHFFEIIKSPRRAALVADCRRPTGRQMLGYGIAPASTSGSGVIGSTGTAFTLSRA